MDTLNDMLDWIYGMPLKSFKKDVKNDNGILSC
jgi:hypothetical protein